MKNTAPIAVTMGEPGGVGPEIVVRSLDPLAGGYSELSFVVGDPDVVEEARELTGNSLPVHPMASADDHQPGCINVLCPPGYRRGGLFPKGRSSAEAGAAVERYIRTAVELCAAGQASAIVTAPISKESLKLAGFSWPGHTELLAELTATHEFAMMLVGGPLRVILVTIHKAIAAVPEDITHDNVLRTIRLAGRAAELLGINRPRIGVAGLNPHAGEGGIFGEEEQHAIRPAVESARALGIPVEGPFPPDTVFHQAYNGRFDIVVCMYHDQGLIPLKMIAFDEGVNVTVGLPFVRTSPDHGTAFDIAWQGRANPSSMLAALRLAARCSGRIT